MTRCGGAREPTASAVGSIVTQRPEGADGLQPSGKRALPASPWVTGPHSTSALNGHGKSSIPHVTLVKFDLMADQQGSELILRLARENNWGYTRILGQLRQLGIWISRQTVKNILTEHGFEPGPLRGKGTWDEFLKSHAATLWQRDCATKQMWTIRGFVDVYFIVFLHLGTRRCWISPSTVNPTVSWSCQQARNFVMHAEDIELPPKYVLRDNDGKYRPEFDKVFESVDAEVVKCTPMSPNLRAHVERFIQTLKIECQDRFVIVSERHLNVINKEFQHWYNHLRPHSERDFLPPACDSHPEPRSTIKINDVVCEIRLGGVLKSYRCRAA